jgi:hypothetical protein
VATRSRSLEYLTRSNDPLSYNQNFSPTFDVRISERQGIVSLSDLRRTTDKLAEVMEAFPTDGLLLLDLFLRGSNAYQDGSYSSCLITNWAITEKLLQELWENYQNDNRTRDGKPFVTGQRLKRLQDSRTYTVAIVTEILSLSSYIDDELYTDIGNARKARNDWMHSLKGMFYEDDAKLATHVCERTSRARQPTPSAMPSRALQSPGRSTAQRHCFRAPISARQSTPFNVISRTQSGCHRGWPIDPIESSLG